MTQRYLLSGFSFDSEGPHLVLDSAERPRTREKFWIRDSVFTLLRQEGRYCIGRYNLATFESFPCPKGALASDTAQSCWDCMRANGFNPAFYNVAREQLSPQQRLYNETPHVLYVAVFGHVSMKAGIASRSRARTRLMEQGARIAAIVASFPDAYAARDIERVLIARPELSETVQNVTKRRLLNTPFDVSRARIVLQEFVERLDIDLNVSEKSIVDLTGDYLGAHELEPPLLDLTDDEPVQISGRGLGMIGDILVMRQGQQQFMLSLKRAIGHMIEIDPVEKPNQTADASTQLNLGF